MSLQGTFDTLPGTEILGVLARSHKTGVLHLQTQESESRIWLLDGRCRAVESADASGPAAKPGDLQERLVDVCFEVARLDAGSFRFVEGAEPPWPTAYDVAGDDALEEVDGLLDEVHDILRVIPSFDACPRLSPELGCPSMTVDAAQWQILAGLDGTRSVNEVVSGSDRSLMEVCGALREMVDLGAVEMLAPGAEASGEGCDAAHDAPPETSLVEVLGDLADLAKVRQDKDADTLRPDVRPAEAAAAEVAPAEVAPVRLREVSVATPYGPGVDQVEPGAPADPPAEPEGTDGEAGATRDRGAMLRLFSAIRDL